MRFMNIHIGVRWAVVRPGAIGRDNDQVHTDTISEFRRDAIAIYDGFHGCSYVKDRRRGIAMVRKIRIGVVE